jgi:hypothetical protein
MPILLNKKCFRLLLQTRSRANASYHLRYFFLIFRLQTSACICVRSIIGIQDHKRKMYLLDPHMCVGSAWDLILLFAKIK